MIEITNVSKSFGSSLAVNQISLTIQDGCVFGLLGTNGAGKSTLLRMMSGVYKQDSGSIKIDGEEVFDNPAAKKKFFFISDDQFFFQNARPKDLADFYSCYYPGFDQPRFYEFLKHFELDPERKVKTYSKGMKRQTALLCGICAGTKYLFCDETFDGLDPVMRQGMKSIFAREMDERGLTPVIASHNLRELEDLCDYVGLIHKGGVLLEKDLENLKLGLVKVQAVLPSSYDSEIREHLEVLKMERRGRLLTISARNTREAALAYLETLHPVYCEALPLTLEEIFISETEVMGYDIKNLIF